MSQPPLIANITSPSKQGQTLPVAVGENFTTATTKDYYFNTEADGVLVSLYVTSVAADLTISVYTLTDLGKELLLTTFPVVSAPSTELLIKKSVNVMSKVKIRAVSTGACVFDLYARGVAAAESSVKVLGATTAQASATPIPTSPTLIIAAALTDRSGMIIRNTSPSSTLYLGFTSLEAVSSVGYPLGPGESLGIDVSAGVDVWGSSSSGTIDVRLLQAGS